ncbi:MAG: PhpK family radical SAM P-methyltransferase [Candidatus Omnitrophota bacterium]
MKRIDCLLIGHNEMDFETYEKSVQRMGKKSGAYRDLNLSFINWNGKNHTAPEIFNLLYGNNNDGAHRVKPLSMLDTFSATISYLGSYLHKHGLIFDYVHSFQREKSELSAKLMKEDILTIAITTTYYVSFVPILEIIAYIRTYNKTAKIIIGGPFVSTQFRSQDPASLEFLFESLGADFYVNSSQGEAALIAIINALKNNSPMESIDNIYYKTPNGSFGATPIVPEDNRLAENRVNWSLFADRIDEFVNVRTAISCPFSCAFCGSPEHAGAYQTIGVAEVENELNQLATIDSLKSVHFIEDTLNVPVERLKEILRMMIKNKYHFKWHSYFRCQFADRETVELMKESGCIGVYLGLESGNNRILQNMNKAATVEKYRDGTALLKEYGITMHGNFIIGFPGETPETVQDTIHFIKESGIDFFRVQLWYGMPITPIWKQKEKYNIQGNSFEWSHHTMDSTTACDLIDRIFLSIKEPVWVPQFNFDINSLFHLWLRGMTWEQINDFLHAFNNGIREKLIDPSRTGMSPQVVSQFQKGEQK